MIPIADVKFGRKLTAEEAISVFENKVKQNEEYQLIAKESGFSESNIEFLAAHKFEVLFEADQDPSFVTRLVMKSGNAVINYQLSTTNENSSEALMGSVQKNEKELTSIIVNNGIVETKNFEYSEELEQDLAEGLPNNEDYVEGQSLTSVSPSYNWGDGCYPFYRHCGRNCGDKGKYGGGAPRDPYDSCCRAHDRCWERFGTNDCGCDCQLLSCAKLNWRYAPPVLHAVVLAYFPRKSTCRC